MFGFFLMWGQNNIPMYGSYCKKNGGLPKRKNKYL